MNAKIIWHLAEPFSTEFCVINDYTDVPLNRYISLMGHITHVSDALPIYTTYFIDVDPTWHTQKVEIETRVNGKYTRLRLATNVRLGSSDAGKWRVNNAPYPALDGCIDIDLGITPATNTLPIRRLGLHPGQSAEVVAAWVRFPALTVEPLPQRYTCLAPDRYRYESPNFTAELTVDPHGLVLDYEGLWRAIAHEEA